MIFENTSCPHLLLHAALPNKTHKYSFLSQNLCGNVAPPHFLAAISHPPISSRNRAEHSRSPIDRSMSLALSSIREEILRKEIPRGAGDIPRQFFFRSHKNRFFNSQVFLSFRTIILAIFPPDIWSEEIMGQILQQTRIFPFRHRTNLSTMILKY
jgi:hypothetical protein